MGLTRRGGLLRKSRCNSRRAQRPFTTFAHPSPADMLHELNLFGINNHTSTPLRPSPLGSNFAPDSYNALGMTPNYSAHSAGGGTLPSEPSPHSNSSGGPSPNAPGKGSHLTLQVNGLHPQYAGSMSSSVSPYSSVSPNGFMMTPMNNMTGQDAGREGQDPQGMEGKDDFAFFEMSNQDPVNVSV